MIRIVPILADEDANLAPDTVWDGIAGDYALGEPDEGPNRDGLRAKEGLATAVLLALMTDAPADPSELRDGDEQRGYPGDAIRLDADDPGIPLGSKLWLLRRRTVNDSDVPILARAYALTALQPLVDQGVCASVDATATADPAKGRLDLAVTLKDRAGSARYSGRFAVLWEETRAV